VAPAKVMVTMFAVPVLLGRGWADNVRVIVVALLPAFTAKVGTVPAVVIVIVGVAGATPNSPEGKLMTISPVVAERSATVSTVNFTTTAAAVTTDPGTAVAVVMDTPVIWPPNTGAATSLDFKSYGVLIEKTPHPAPTGVPDLKLFAVVDVRVTVRPAAVMSACAAMVIVVDVNETAPVILPVAVALPVK